MSKKEPICMDEHEEEEEEEEETCSPNFLTELFEILDVNKDTVKNEKSSPITEWKRQYKAISDEYNQKEAEVVELIEKFNEYAENCEQRLYDMSRKFINITNKSPGETKQFKEMMKSAKSYKITLQEEPDCDTEYLKDVKKLYSAMLKFKKIGKPIDLETMQTFSDQMAELL